MADEVPIVHTVTLHQPKPEIIIAETKSTNGKPMIQMIFTGGNYPTVLKCGVGKVRMMLHSVPELQAFHDKYGASLDK